MTNQQSIKARVVGYGSIGQRHTEILSHLGCEVAVVSRRLNVYPSQFGDLELAIEDWKPDYCVIASRTSEHETDLETLVAARFEGKVLIEKPIFANASVMPANDFDLVRVAFNLRCHPVMSAMLNELKGHAIRAAHGYVGQYLPNWRPGQDYRQSYSASAKDGGGVLLDLSHDIDIMTQITGGWTALTALGGKVSGLEITSEDCFALLFQGKTCPIATLNMNYLDYDVRREYLVHCDTFSLKADFITGVLEKNGEVVFRRTLARNDTYIDMHTRMLHKRGYGLCNVSEGLQLMETIAATRQAAHKMSWKQHV